MGDETGEREQIEGREGETMGKMEGAECVPGGPVGGECTWGETVEDSGLGLEVEELEGWI